MPPRVSPIILFLVSFLTGMLFIRISHAETKPHIEYFPETLGEWDRVGDVQMIGTNEIFHYMDGAGELYLSYRFDHLEVAEYTADQQDTILAEVYVMASPDDAFGLFSLDWDGEPVLSAFFPVLSTHSLVAPPVRALYGDGLLRMAIGSRYARVMAYRETPESRKAVLALGRAIATGREFPVEPEFLNVLPLKVGFEWSLQNDRLRYFRASLVLDSFYYPGHQNFLNLDHATEAVLAPYEHVTTADASKPVQFLGVKYPTPERAKQAFRRLHETYLSEHQKECERGIITKLSGIYEIEGTWAGYALDNTCLFMVFESPNREAARTFLEQVSCKTAHKG